MPPLKPVQGVARIAARGTANGQAVVNIFHVSKEAVPGGTMLPWSQAEVTAFATAFDGFYKGRFASSLNSVYSGDDIHVVDLTSPTGYEAFVANTCNGSSVGTNFPQSAAACITWKIARHYRGGHPRTYIGPLGGPAFENQISLNAA